MNDYLFQLAMVINTSYENFHDNLLNIIIYVILNSPPYLVTTFE